MSNKYPKQGEHQVCSLSGALIGYRFGKWKDILRLIESNSKDWTFLPLLCLETPVKDFLNINIQSTEKLRNGNSNKMGAKILNRPEKKQTNKNWILSQQWRKLSRSSICTTDLPRGSEIVSTSYLWKCEDEVYEEVVENRRLD